MSINIFHLAFGQPLVWGALVLIAGEAFFALLPPFDAKDSEIFPFFPQLNWLCKIIIAAVVLIWLAVVILNHQTFWADALNFVFLLGFSIVWMYVMLLAYILVFITLCLLSGVLSAIGALIVFIFVGIGSWLLRLVR